MGKAKLTEQDFARAAAALSCSVAAIKAVTKVEAPKGGFLPDGQVTILPERHWFHRLTHGRWTATHPDISNPEAGGYGAEGQHQHDRLQRMTKLDRVNGLMATSWGKFQIMGFNHAAAGFPVLQAFITAMHHSEAAQLDAFVNFIKSDGVLWRALRLKDWTTFARLYNGKGYAKHNYHGRMADAFKLFGGT